MAQVRGYPVSKDPEVAALREATRANVDDLERRVKALEARVAKLERLADYVRGDHYEYLTGLAAAVAYATPPEPPDR